MCLETRVARARVSTVTNISFAPEVVVVVCPPGVVSGVKMGSATLHLSESQKQVSIFVIVTMFVELGRVESSYS